MATFLKKTSFVMKKELKCAAAALLIMASLCAPLTARAEVIDKIVAILGRDLLLLSEIREQTNKPVVRLFANLRDSPTLEQDALPYLVERRILRQEIEYLAEPKERDLMLTLAFQYLADAYHQGNADDLRARLTQQAVPQADIEAELLLYMKGMDYIRRKYRFSEDIESPETVRRLFRAWIDDLKQKTALQILP